MDSSSYVTFLIIGIVIVLLDGQLIARSARGYLRNVYEPGALRSMVGLVGALFHFVTLGLLALISLIGVDTGLPVRDTVVKIGVLLLVLAVAHGLTILILMRIRDRRWQEQVAAEMTEGRYPTNGHGADIRASGSGHSPASPTEWRQ